VTTLQIIEAAATLQFVVGGEPTFEVSVALPPMLAFCDVGIQGPPGEGMRHVHIQSAALTEWTVNHNFGRAPSSVRVLSPGGVEVDAAVLDLNLNQIAIAFAQPFAGRAIVI